MRLKNLGIIAVFLFVGCASVPKETVLLSQTLGNDIQLLHKSHRAFADIHFEKIKKDINSYVDDVYTPFVIHYVLKKELKKYKNHESSLFGVIEIAGKVEGIKESKDAIDIMQEFQEAARNDIERQRNELLNPIKKQHSKIVQSINQSYESVSYANARLTAYLQTLRRLKDSQQKALSKIGLEGADHLLSNSLIKMSELVEKSLKKGKEIDIQSDDAYDELKKISKQIKEITSKK